MKILVSERIRELIEAEKISQYALAKRLRINPSTVSNWLSCKKEPSIESLWKLADYFDVSIDYLIGRREI